MVTVRNKTVGDIQSEFEAALTRLASSELPPGVEALKALMPPQGMAIRVSLRKSDSHRQIRRSADVSNWNPATCEAVISFELADQLSDDSEVWMTSGHVAQASDPLADVVKTLDSAEREPQFREFVGIKLFRDKYLVARGFAWAVDPADRHTVLSKAIAQGLVLKNSVPNPKEPSFPTTSIRVHREHPEVKQILAASVAERSKFKPIVLPGVSLSSTVLAERR
jgi:hypothetical protein